MKITTKGQLTIPKKFRDKYGFRSDVEVEIVEDRGQLRIVKKDVRRTPFDEVVGILKSKERTDDIIERLRGR